MHFSLVKICPPGSPAHGFDDAVLPMYHALRRLGFSVEIRLNTPNPATRNIVFGSCVSPRLVGRTLPRSSIIVNLEQLVPGSIWMNNNYITHLRDFTVWDYSKRNLGVLHGLGITNTVLVPLGYVPEMTRLRPDFPEDIDVLFYGLLNDRRAAVLGALQERGIRAVAAPSDTFSDKRDALIARAKIILNVHFTLPASLEVVRLGYVWANRKAVVSERHESTEVDPCFSRACAYFPYGGLTEGVLSLLADAKARLAQAESGYAAFAARPLEGILKAVVGQRLFAASAGAGGMGGDTAPKTPLSEGPCPPETGGLRPYLPGITQSWIVGP